MLKKSDKPISREKQFKSQSTKLKTKYLIDKLINVGAIVYHKQYKASMFHLYNSTKYMDSLKKKKNNK